jgi:biotin carboxyl carrier protein
LKGYIEQNRNGSVKLSARLMNTVGKDIKKFEVDNLELRTVSATEMEIYNNGVQSRVQVYEKHHQIHVFDREGNNFSVTNHYDQVEKKTEQIVDKEFVKAQMPGIVVRLPVKKGDKVKKGDAVAYLEAMKMEHKILAQEDCTIVEVLVEEKGFVEAGQPLIKIQSAAGN